MHISRQSYDLNSAASSCILGVEQLKERVVQEKSQISPLTAKL